MTSEERACVREITSANEMSGLRAASAEPGRRLHALAASGAFALIAAIVFGTLSYHPF
jgi:hypothetical protein